MKVEGRLLADGSGEIRAAREDGSMPNRWVPVSAAPTRGGMLARMREAALKFAQDLDPDDEVEFEIRDDPDDEPGVSKGQVDPELVAPAKLQARRAAGEHLCFFCTKDPICAIAGSTRQHALALVVISGCSQFLMVADA